MRIDLPHPDHGKLPVPRCDHCGAPFALRGDLVIEAVIAARHSYNCDLPQAHFYPTCDRCGRRSVLDGLIAPVGAARRPWDAMLGLAERLRARDDDDIGG